MISWPEFNCLLLYLHRVLIQPDMKVCHMSLVLMAWLTRPWRWSLIVRPLLTHNEWRVLTLRLSCQSQEACITMLSCQMDGRKESVDDRRRACGEGQGMKGLGSVSQRCLIVFIQDRPTCSSQPEEPKPRSISKTNECTPVGRRALPTSYHWATNSKWVKCFQEYFCTLLHMNFSSWN